MDLNFVWHRSFPFSIKFIACFIQAYNSDAALSSGTSPTPPKVLVDEFKQYRKSFYKECIKNAIKVRYKSY